MPAQFLPPQFRLSVFERDFTVRAPRPRVFAWFNDPRTFTSGNPFPYRVEFVGSENGAQPGFAPGVQTAHHGPLMLFAGEIGEVRSPEYRDLPYYYGSYVLSMRLIRPVRLEFFFTATPAGETVVKLKMTSFVRPVFLPFWSFAQRVFCWVFHWNIRFGVKRHERSVES
jgi:hypothetical protein